MMVERAREEARRASEQHENELRSRNTDLYKQVRDDLSCFHRTFPRHWPLLRMNWCIQAFPSLRRSVPTAAFKGLASYHCISPSKLVNPTWLHRLDDYIRVFQHSPAPYSPCRSKSATSKSQPLPSSSGISRSSQSRMPRPRMSPGPLQQGLAALAPNFTWSEG